MQFWADKTLRLLEPTISGRPDDWYVSTERMLGCGPYDSDDERSALCDVQQQHIGYDNSDDATVRAVLRQVLNI